MSLPKKYYVEPSKEEIILEDENGIIHNIKEFIKNIF